MDFPSHSCTEGGNSAREILPEGEERAVEHDYGTLDFTAAACKPHLPYCEACLLSGPCAYEQRVERGKGELGYRLLTKPPN
jgi:adenine-specific DNA glycosylase